MIVPKYNEYPTHNKWIMMKYYKQPRMPKNSVNAPRKWSNFSKDVNY